MSIINSIKEKLSKIHSKNANTLTNMKTVAVDREFNPVTDFTQKLVPEDYYICDDIYPATLMVVCRAAK